MTTIHAWSTPRSLSTATLYSWASREDVEHALDEPLYPVYLHTNPSVERPYREELLAQNPETNARAVQAQMERMASEAAAADPASIIYAKHISKFYDPNALDLSRLFKGDGSGRVVHVLMMRDPLDVVRSWSNRAENGVTGGTCDMADCGFAKLLDVYMDCVKFTGREPVVVDTELLGMFPREILMELCARIGVPFEETMLSWEKGPKACDGMWAKHWYSSVWETTGFGKKTKAQQRADPSLLPDSEDCVPLSQEQLLLYRACLPIYDFLRRNAIGRHPLCPATSHITASSLHLPLTGAIAAAAAAAAATSSTAASSSSSSSPAVIDHGLHMTVSELSDPRNADVLMWVGDRLVPREHARVSALDSAVQGGDAVWEGMRVYKGRVFHMKPHLDRLFDSARAMAFDETKLPSRAFVEAAVRKTCAANGMRDGAHMRLTLSRGVKTSSSMNPAFNAFGACLIIVPEWKPVGGKATYDNDAGVDLITATNRRNPPQCVDSRIHHCNLINNILPKVKTDTYPDPNPDPDPDPDPNPHTHPKSIGASQPRRGGRCTHAGHGRVCGRNQCHKCLCHQRRSLIDAHRRCLSPGHHTQYCHCDGPELGAACGGASRVTNGVPDSRRGLHHRHHGRVDTG